MRTKTLLIAAAALAATVISSEAQTVYSSNISGYVNATIGLGYNTVSIPLSSSTGNNALTNTIPNTGQLDGANLYLFTGTTFTKLTFDSGFPTGFGDGADQNQANTPVINPGTAFYINNNTGFILTNIFVGNVQVSPLVAGSGTSTNTLVPGQSFVSSVLAVGGGLISSLQFSNVASALNGTLVLVPNITGNPAAVHGYSKSTYDDGFTTGFGDGADQNQAPEPIIPLGSGFIYNNNAGGGNILWVQTLNP